MMIRSADIYHINQGNGPRLEVKGHGSRQLDSDWMDIVPNRSFQGNDPDRIFQDICYTKVEDTCLCRASDICHWDSDLGGICQGKRR